MLESVFDNPRGRPAVNLGLGTFLLAYYLHGLGPSAFDQPPDLDLVAFTVLTAALLVYVVLRPAPVAEDRRWWVCVIAALSLSYVAFFDPIPAEGTVAGFRTATLAWTLLGLRMAGQLCLLSLGTSFAILPALRTVRVGFLYRFVRHPAYAIYMLTDVTFLCLAPSIRNFLVVMTGSALFVTRAALEERVLMHHADYRAYRARTPWRFVPGLC